MESMPQNDKNTTLSQQKLWQDRIYYYQGFCQVGAVCIDLFAENQICNFWAVIPIQLVSFMMTLNHKNFGRKKKEDTRTSRWQNM